MVSNNTGLLTKSESKEVTRLSAELTNMVTTLVPLSNISHKCEDKLLLKTMITPHIDYRARMEVEMVEGRLQYKYKNDSTYILISQDAVLSQSTKMFNQDIHVIGRTCTVHKTINSSSSSTGNALFENFHFAFEGNLTMTETCPFNGSTISSKWTFFSTADIRLPLVCSITSPKINCGSVSLRTSQTKEIHLEHHRMHIFKDTSEEAKVTLNTTAFIKSKDVPAPIPKSAIFSFMDSQKWPIIGLGAGVVVIITLLITLKLFINKNQANGGVAVTIQNSAVSSNTPPSCPEATTAHTGTNPMSGNLEQDSPPEYASLEIKSILAKEPHERDPFEKEALARHSLKLKSRNPTPSPV